MYKDLIRQAKTYGIVAEEEENILPKKILAEFLLKKKFKKNPYIKNLAILEKIRKKDINNLYILSSFEEYINIFTNFFYKKSAKSLQ